MTSKPNIIFIVMDALRANNLSCYRYPRKTSPNIDQLAKNGVLFKAAFSSNNATDKSVLSILSGRHILLGDSRDVLLTKQEISSFFFSGGTFLQEILKKNGYKTYCLKDLHTWQKKGFDYYPKKGLGKPKKKGLLTYLKTNQKINNLFQFVVHKFASKKFSNKIKAKYGRVRSENVTEKAIQILKKTEKEEGFFMWIDYNDTHIPYNPREFTNTFKAGEESDNFFKKIQGKNYRKQMVRFWKRSFNKNETIEDIIARYDSAIAYDDYLIGKVIKTLKDTKLIQNTILFVLSDHGENFGEHGIYWGHHGLYDTSTHVPFIITGKSIPKNKKISGLIQHKDLAPTVLDILGISYNPTIFDGTSLVPLIYGKKKKVRDFIFMEEGDDLRKKAIRTTEYKYLESPSEEAAVCRICNHSHRGVLELYNLKKDPNEEENLVKKNPDLLKKMKTMLDKHIKEMKILNERRRIKENLSKIKSIPKS